MNERGERDIRYHIGLLWFMPKGIANKALSQNLYICTATLYLLHPMYTLSEIALKKFHEKL